MGEHGELATGFPPFLEDPFVYQPGTHFSVQHRGHQSALGHLDPENRADPDPVLTAPAVRPPGAWARRLLPCLWPTAPRWAAPGCYLTLEAMARFTQFVANRGPLGAASGC